jgi:hypothetical protein
LHIPNHARNYLSLKEFIMTDLSKQLSEGFILTVGITPPKPGRELTASRYIVGMLVLAVAGAAAMFTLILHHLL